jgi:hypothetical protein
MNGICPKCRKYGTLVNVNQYGDLKCNFFDCGCNTSYLWHGFDTWKFRIIRFFECLLFGHVPGKRDKSITQMQCSRCGKHGI